MLINQIFYFSFVYYRTWVSNTLKIQHSKRLLFWLWLNCSTRHRHCTKSYTCTLNVTYKAELNASLFIFFPEKKPIFHNALVNSLSHRKVLKSQHIEIPIGLDCQSVGVLETLVNGYRCLSWTLSSLTVY